MFKISKNFSLPLMGELFHKKVNYYDLRNPSDFSIPNVISVFMDKKGAYRTCVHSYGS